MNTAVLLISHDGTKEFVRDSHVHGVRDGRLLLATGTPGAGLDAEVVREVELADLTYAETVEQEADASGSECGVPDGAESFDLVVDGERFSVRFVVDPDGSTSTRYTWLSGQHSGYGFGSGGPQNLTMEEHQQQVRKFLAMVDPTTGYIEAN